MFFLNPFPLVGVPHVLRWNYNQRISRFKEYKTNRNGEDVKSSKKKKVNDRVGIMKSLSKLKGTGIN